MSRMTSIFAVLVLTAVVGLVPTAFAANPTVEVTLSGSSAFWQTAALGAFNNGTSLVAGATGGHTCHWTSASNKIALVDSRPTLVSGTANTDNGTLWVVWDVGTGGTCGTTAANHMWAFNKVDSVVGVRCYEARPQCDILGTSNGSTGTLDGNGSNQISLPNSVWGTTNDVALPANIITVLTGGAGTLNKTKSAASDIRLEDAEFATCRVNSLLGNGSVNNTKDNLDGLGYGTNASGACAPSSGGTLAQLVGTPIQSGVIPATGATANPLAFSLGCASGCLDPFSGTAVPAASSVSVGGEPMVFVVSRSNSLQGVHNATSTDLASIFGGDNCNASAIGGSGAINVFLREPLSGTMNTTEAVVFRRPTVDGASATAALGTSQEKGVGSNNPLQTPCASGGGKRFRGIGTGEVVNNGVKVSNTAYGADNRDGIAYTFFSYGNVSKIAANDSYGYIALNGVDPIFSSYGNQLGSGAPFDPGQPADGAVGGAGELPGAANLPAGNCESGAAAFPCSEDLIWAGNPTASTTNPPTGLSFPNLRNGSYTAWGVLRVASDTSGTNSQLANLKVLVTGSNKVAVGFVPDYVPAVAVNSFCSPSGKALPCVAPDHTVPKDPGMTLLRSHYQQKDGDGNNIGGAPVNSGTTEAGGDMGGRILSTTAVTQKNITQQVQGSLGFQIRP